MNLGFGMMRLPVKSSPTDFDYSQLNQMVDEFLTAGFNYFDTSYVYHNGRSQIAVRKSLVERHPRESFLVATKFPTFKLIPEFEIESIFTSQLNDLGVDYIDYYLLHNLQNVYYDGIDGKGGIVKETHLFEHAQKWKAEGKIKHLGFSFHSSAKLLDRILTDHPETEFVQIALNPIDWDSEFVQAKECYEVIRRHGKQVVVMEPIKGGGLSQLPKDAERILKSVSPDRSISSWSLRWMSGLDGILVYLSGMSNLEQLTDNISTCRNLVPLNKEEQAAYAQALKIYRDSAPIPPVEIAKYKGLDWSGVPVTAIPQAYSICQIQPDPAFADDNNYLKNALIEYSHLDLFGDLPKSKVILPNGEDKTEFVEKCVNWLKEHSF